MDAPAECPVCEGPLARQFSANANINIPISFRQCLTGGAEGGGGLSWSDFHDVSEKELARDPNIERQSTLASQAGIGSKKERNARLSRDAFRKAASDALASVRARQGV
jgi:hypothetical protein